MILTKMILNSLPEKQKEVMQTLTSMMETAGKEKGCLSCDVSCNINVNSVFYLIEEWDLREDLERHISSERFSILLGTKSLLSNPLKMKIHSVSLTEGEEIINTVRNKGVSK